MAASHVTLAITLSTLPTPALFEIFEDANRALAEIEADMEVCEDPALYHELLTEPDQYDILVQLTREITKARTGIHTEADIRVG